MAMSETQIDRRHSKRRSDGAKSKTWECLFRSMDSTKAMNVLNYCYSIIIKLFTLLPYALGPVVDPRTLSCATINTLPIQPLLSVEFTISSRHSS